MGARGSAFSASVHGGARGCILVCPSHYHLGVLPQRTARQLLCSGPRGAAAVQCSSGSGAVSVSEQQAPSLLRLQPVAVSWFRRLWSSSGVQRLGLSVCCWRRPAAVASGRGALHAAACCAAAGAGAGDLAACRRGCWSWSLRCSSNKSAAVWRRWSWWQRCRATPGGRVA